MFYMTFSRYYVPESYCSITWNYLNHSFLSATHCRSRVLPHTTELLFLLSLCCPGTCGKLHLRSPDKSRLVLLLTNRAERLANSNNRPAFLTVFFFQKTRPPPIPPLFPTTPPFA